MTILYQTGTAIADTDKLTLAAWTRGSSAAFGAIKKLPLLTFGDPAGIITSQILFGPDRVGNSGCLSFQLVGAPSSARVVTSGSITTDDYFSTPVLGSYSDFSSDSVGRNFISNSWNLLLLSADVSGTASVTCTNVPLDGSFGKYALAGNSNRLSCSINGLDCSPNALNFDGVHFFSPTDPSPPGSTNGGNLSSIQTPGTSPIFFHGGENIGPGGSITASGWQMAVNGFSIGLPCQPEQAGPSFNGLFQVAYYQAWFGKFIDVNSNLETFATRKNGRLLPPSDPFKAAKAFGTPDLMFYRDKRKGIKFEKNHGTAGAFTLSGNATDYSPGPGQ